MNKDKKFIADMRAKGLKMDAFEKLTKILSEPQQVPPSIDSFIKNNTVALEYNWSATVLSGNIITYPDFCKNEYNNYFNINLNN